ncbi:MAG: tetratricopeptide repeat protein [Flavobacteriales bacterium]|nr:tetratricopeptide repeat protein [Flavobacteriales bacterium]
MKPLAPMVIAGALLGLAPNFAHAQAPDPIDSLKRAIRTAENDTTKLSAMIALSERVYAENPDTNKTICRSAIALADRSLARKDIGPKERSTLLMYKASAINNLAASHYMFGDLDSALLCFREARSIHAANRYTPGIADALNNEGLVLGILGRYAEQRDMLFRAKEVYVNAGDMGSAAKALNNIATYYKDQGRPDTALLYWDSCLYIYEGLQDLKGIADSRLNIGQALGEQGEAANALEQYLISERLYEQLNDDRGLAFCLGNIANILDAQGLSEEALVYAHRSLDIKIAIGDSIAQAAERMNIGTILEDQGEHDLALAEYAKSLAVFARSGSLSNEAAVHGRIGSALKNKGDLDSALVHYRMSRAISETIGNPADISNALYDLGHYFEQTNQLDSALANYRACLAIDERVKDRQGQSFALFSIARIKLLQHKPAEAEQWARRSLELAQELGFPRNIMRATEVLHQALEQQGKWREALGMLKLHRQMADSVEGKEAAKNTLRLQLRYGFRQTQVADSLRHAVELAHVETERQAASAEAEQMAFRNKALASGTLLLLIGGGVIFQLDRRRRRAKYQRDAAQLELKALRAQMNPHFIFNALASINDYVLENERDLASDYLTKFARLMRLVLENSRKPLVPLVKDMEALQLYMELECLRSNGSFEHVIDMATDIDAIQVMVPPLAIQPFVENAIRHGLAKKDGNGHLGVTIRNRVDHLLVTVEDDGVGRGRSTTSAADNKTSLGTHITQARLDLLTMSSRRQATIRYTDLPQGTRVEVELPWVLQG